MTDQPGVFVIWPGGTFEITDEIVGLGSTGGGGNRWELALTDEALAGYGADPTDFRSAVAAGSVQVRLEGYPATGIMDGPIVYQMYLATDTVVSECGVFWPTISARHFYVVVDGIPENWVLHEVPEPGSLRFYNGGPAYVYLSNSPTQHQLNAHINTTHYGETELGSWTQDTDAGDLDPQISFPVVGAAAQFRLPEGLPSPDWMRAEIYSVALDMPQPVNGAASDSSWDGSTPTPEAAELGILQEDGSWMIPVTLGTAPEGEEPYTWAGLAEGFNHPPSHEFTYPEFVIYFGWYDSGGYVDLTDPFEMVGVWFYYDCSEEPPPPPPPPGEVGVAPPLRIYPRHDQSAMGTPRVFPKSPSRQHGNRVGPGSYT